MDPTTNPPPTSQRRREFPPLEELLPIARLNRMMRSFSDISGVACALMDPDFEWIGRSPKMPKFCQLAHGHDNTEDLCRAHARQLGELAGRDRTVAMGSCESGLLEFVAPILLGDYVLGFIFGGPVLAPGESESGGKHSSLRAIAVERDLNVQRLQETLDSVSKARSRDDLKSKARAMGDLAQEIGATALMAYQARALADLSTLLTIVSSKEDAYDLVLDCVELVYRRTKVAIYEVQEGVYPLVADRNDSFKGPRFEHRADNSIVGLCVRSGKLRYDADLTKLRGTSTSLPSLSYGDNVYLRSSLTVPVRDLATNEMKLCIQVCSNEKSAFDDQLDREFLQTVADLLAAAYDRSRDEEEVDSSQLDQATRMTALSTMEEQLLQTSADADVDQTLELFLQTAMSIGECDSAEILVCVPNRKQLSVQAATGVFKQAEGVYLTSEPHSVERVLSRGRPWRIRKPRKGARDFQELVKAHGMRFDKRVSGELQSAALLPIGLQRKTTGVLALYARKRGSFGQESIRVLQYLADRVAAVLADTEQQRKARVDAFDARAVRWILELAHWSMEVAQDRDVVRAELSGRLARQACQIARVHFASVRSYCPVTKRLHFEADAGAEKPERAKEMLERGWGPADENSAGGYAAITAEPYVFGSLANAEHYRTVFPEVRSHASIPIKCGGNVELILSVDSVRENAFERDSWVFERLQRLAIDAESVLVMVRSACEHAAASFGEVCMEATSTNDLCHRAAHALRDALDTCDCTVFLTTPAGDEIEAAGTTGLEGDDSDSSLRRYSIASDTECNGCTPWVVRYGETLLINNLEDPNSYPDKEPKPAWTNKHRDASDRTASRLAFLGVPIVVHDKVIGVVRFSVRRSLQRFSPQDNDLAERLARQLGIAVQRIRYVNRTAASRELENVRLRKTLKTTAGEMAGVAKRLVDCDAVHIRVLEGEQLRLVVAVGQSMEGLPAVRKIGEPFSGRVAQEGRLVTVQDVSAPRHWAKLRNEVSENLEGWVQSMACAPLVAGDNVIGTISFHSCNTDWFNADRIPVMEEISSHCALLLRHAKVHEDQMSLTNATLKTTGQIVENPSTVTVESVAKEVANAFAGVVPFAASTVWLFNQSKSHLERVAFGAHGDRKTSPRDVPEALCLETLSESVFADLATCEPLLGDRPRTGCGASDSDTEIPDSLREWLKSAGMYMVAPLKFGDDLIGGVLCYGVLEEGFTLSDEHVKRISHLSQQAAVAIEAAGLLERQRSAMDVAAPLAMMGALLDAFLHQMTQPVNNIQLLLHNALRISKPGTPLTGKLATIRDQTRRLETTIVELKTFVAGQGVQTATTLDLGSVVRKVADRTRADLPASIEQTEEIPDEAVSIQGVEPILLEALRMAVVNAVEAMPDGGTLHFRVRQNGKHASVQIEDTGIGMSEPVAHACRQCFFTTKQHGSGLGLAVVQAACNWHHGALGISSQPGQGTTVDITLPFGGRRS
ncbi:MAG: GAF domain-containing protein [Planctomycetes bacterium]|nr:GAF domain-containing protein [Planctomycetota bacterium]